MQSAVNKFLPFPDRKRQFIIPIYQRTYRWTQERLWHDILQVAENGLQKSHFISSKHWEDDA